MFDSYSLFEGLSTYSAMKITGKITAEDAAKASRKSFKEMDDIGEVVKILEEFCYPAVSRSMSQGLMRAEVNFDCFDWLTMREVMRILRNDGYGVIFRTPGRWSVLEIDWQHVDVV